MLSKVTNSRGRSGSVWKRAQLVYVIKSADVLSMSNLIKMAYVQLKQFRARSFYPIQTSI